MKWVYLIVVLVVGGWLAYALFMRPAPAGTPHATAEAYVKAAVANDMAAVDALCLPQAQSEARGVAQTLRALAGGTSMLSFSAMRTDPPRTGLSSLVQGRMLGIEMVKEGETWKIIEVSLSD
ncbi:hypothetical protein JW916_13455 [Candidatus Sumerlaeota bacterium]|nr:hypothetical protein [Candidatus Sumerlaeota bacterium]